MLKCAIRKIMRRAACSASRDLVVEWLPAEAGSIGRAGSGPD
jgi:hypothetical protein